MNKETLKNQALVESISNLTANYENKIADLRVEITEISQALNAANQELEQLRNQLTVEEETSEVVQDEATD